MSESSDLTGDTSDALGGILAAPPRISSVWPIRTASPSI